MVIVTHEIEANWHNVRTSCLWIINNPKSLTCVLRDNISNKIESLFVETNSSKVWGSFKRLLNVANRWKHKSPQTEKDPFSSESFKPARALNVEDEEDWEEKRGLKMAGIVGRLK